MPIPTPVAHGFPLRLRPEARLGVLDITKYFGPTSGGIKTYLLEKSRYVATRPYLRQILVVPGTDDRITTESGARTYHLKGPRIPGHPPHRLLLSANRLRRIIEHECPDVIEIGSALAVPWVARFANRFARVPTVWFYHSHLPRIAAPDPWSTGLGTRVLEAVMARGVRALGDRFPRVICASDYAAAELAKAGLDPARVSKVPLGVDLALFQPDRRFRAIETRRARKLPEAPIALYAGRFAAEKGLDLILDAWAEVERRTGFRLALLGDGPRTAVLRAHRYADRVLWLPYERDRDRLADLLAAVDLTIAPGRFETFGLAALESLASGTPVLASSDGGAAELVAKSGAGARFEVGDAACVAETMVRLAQTDLSALGRLGRAHAEQHHSWDGALKRLFKVYQQIRAVA